jgi:hypothetical protein
VSRLWSFARSYGLDLLIVMAAIESVLDTGFSRCRCLAADAGGSARPCRRLLAAAFSFVDGRLVGSAGGLFAAGTATSFPGQPMSQQSEQPHRW